MMENDHVELSLEKDSSTKKIGRNVVENVGAVFALGFVTAIMVGAVFKFYYACVSF